MKKLWKVLIDCCFTTEDLELEFKIDADTDSVTEFAPRKSSKFDLKVRVNSNGYAREDASEERVESRVDDSGGKLSKMEEER